MEHVHFTLKNSEQSLLCVLREGNHTGAYSTDIRFKIVTEDAGPTIELQEWQQDGKQSPARNMVHGIVCSSDLEKNLL